MMYNSTSSILNQLAPLTVRKAALWSSHNRNSTQFMRRRANGSAHYWSQIQFILRNSWRRSKTKVLQEAGKEEENLHSGQTLPRTLPATCEGKQKEYFQLICKISEYWGVMGKFTNLLKKARRHLAWQTSHLCPGSEQDKSCWGVPTQSHHTGRMSREDTLWSPVDNIQYFHLVTSHLTQHPHFELCMIHSSKSSWVL